MTYYVYSLVDPSTSIPFYIGKGKWANQRHRDHLRETEETTSNRFKFYKIRSIREQGFEPTVVLLKTDIVDEEEAYTFEETQIAEYGLRSQGGVLTNICYSRRPPDHTGRPKSEAHRQALSESHKGKIFTADHLANMRAAKEFRTLTGWPKGQPRSEETKRKISEAKTNCTQTPESNIKRSIALKGKAWSEARRNADSGRSGPPKGRGWSEARRRAHEEKKNGKRV